MSVDILSYTRIVKKGSCIIQKDGERTILFLLTLPQRDRPWTFFLATLEDPMTGMEFDIYGSLNKIFQRIDNRWASDDVWYYKLSFTVPSEVIINIGDIVRVRVTLQLDANTPPDTILTKLIKLGSSTHSELTGVDVLGWYAHHTLHENI